MKEDVSADPCVTNEVSLLLGEVDSEGEAIGRNAGSGEPSRGDLALFTLAIDPNAHQATMGMLGEMIKWRRK